jgi:putative MATE family efflux protein
MPGLKPLNSASRPTIAPSFFALAWPSLVENVLLTVMGMISMMMVGRLGPSAMAGVGAANQILNLSIVIFNGLAVGTTALVARRVGSGDRVSAQAAIAQSLGIGTLASLVIAIVGFVVAEPVLRLMGTEPEVAVDGAVYLRGVMAATPLMVVTLIANGGLRGSGDTRTPMIVTAAANVANVLVAYPLIFGIGGLPALGIAGAAWGIVVARLVGFLMVGRKLLDGQAGSVPELLRSMRFDGKVLRPLMRISLPSAAESGMVQVGMMIFSLITISLGTEAFAAQQIVFTIANLSMMPGVAFSTAATTLVGQALGAKNPAQAEASGWRGARSAAIWMSCMGAVFLLFPEFFARMYTDDLAVIRQTVTGLMVVGCGQPLQGLAFVLSGALRGAGDTKTTMQRGTFSMWFVRLPIAYVCGVTLGLGVFGVWLGWVADWVLRSVFFIVAFRAGKWKQLRI